MDLRKGRQRMQSRTASADDFPHFDASHQERIGDQGTVATPRNGLGAHDRDPLQGCERNEFVKMLLEIRGLHVIGIAAEACVAPTHVY